MINDQDQLFMLIADNLEEDVECIAFGGTAMMYMNYKNTTKDIDLFFNTDKERAFFIKAIEKLGYSKKQILKQIYSNKKSSNQNAPLMYTRGELERFDLFAKHIFTTDITQSIRDRAKEIRDYNGRNQLRIKVISAEDLVLLKSVTNRERDLEDVETIVTKTENFSWKTVILEAKQQTESWTLLDVEETMQKIKDSVLIRKEEWKLLYS